MLLEQQVEQLTAKLAVLDQPVAGLSKEEKLRAFALARPRFEDGTFASYQDEARTNYRFIGGMARARGAQRDEKGRFLPARSAQL